MKPTLALRSFLLLTGSVFLAAHMAQAADLYWDSNGTTAGAGDTPAGTWGVDNFWNTDSTGGAGGAFQIPTLSTDDLFFSAGSDAVNPYTIGLNSATQNARRVTFEDGTATLTTGTLSLGTGGGITLTSGTVTGATISSGLTLSGNQTLNIAASRTLTLDTGAFTRNAGATLNVLSTGTVTTTMSGLDSASLVNGIIGPWASHGTGASTRYATIDGSNNIVAYTGGTAAATAANVTSALGTLNYDVAAVGTLGAGANINTLRYTGGAGTIAGSLTTNGIMNVGGGALVFSGAMTSGSGEMVIHAANGGIQFSGGLNNSGNRLTITGSGNVNFSATANKITGAGGLTMNGTGLLTLAAGGTNPGHDYTGTTVINSGTVMIAAASKSAGNFTLNGGMLTDYYQSTTIFTSGLGSGNNQIQIYGDSGFGGGNGSSTWRIGVSNSVLKWGTLAEGGTGFFNPTTLKFLAPGVDNMTTGGIHGLVSFNNGLDLNGAVRTIAVQTTSGTPLSSTATITGTIVNTNGVTVGGLTKTGAGNLILSNTGNTYNGATTISAGALTAAGTGSLGNSSATNTLIFNGGTLRASGAITSAATRSVTMTSTGIIDNNGQAISIAGNISGAGGLTKNGNGTLTLSGTNNYGGVTTVNTGTLAITKEAALASNTAANLNVKSGGTLALNVDSAGSAGFSTSNLNTLLGNISVANTAAQGLQAGATLGLDTATATGGTFTPSAAITNSTGASGGTIGLNKLGAGTLVLNQANTFTGNTTVTNGTLQLGSGATAGSLSSSLINIGSGATFAVNQSDTITQGTDFSALITGAGSLANVGSGTLVLNAPTFHTGNTTATAGNITLNDASAIRFSALNTTGAGTVTLGTGVTSPTFGGLANSGVTRNLASVIDSSYANVTNLTLNPQSGSTTYGGVVADGAAGMTLTKTGAGTQILQGTNTYTGSTNIINGTLTLSGASGSIASTAINLNGGALTLDNATNSGTRVDNAATITVNASSALNFTHGAAASTNYTETIGTLALTAGTLTFTGTQASNTGPGTSILTFSNPLSRSGASNTSTVNFTGTGLGTNSRNRILFTGQTAGDLGPWAVVNGADFASYDATNGIVATAFTTLAAGSNNSATNFRQSTNIASLDLSLNPSYKTLQILSADTNTRSLGLNGNTVSVGGISATGGATAGHTISGTGAVQTLNAGDALYVHVNNFNLNVNSTIQNVGAGSTASTLVKSGGGTLTLGGTNTYSGGTVINAGTLVFDSALNIGGSNNTGGSTAPITVNGTATMRTVTNTAVANLGTGAISINNGAILTLTGTSRGTYTIGGAITGTGGVTLGYGSFWGIARLNSTSNTFEGPLTITGGNDDGNSRFNINSLADGAGYGNIILNVSSSEGDIIGLDYGSGGTNGTGGGGAIAPLVLNNRQIVVQGTSINTFNNSSNQAVTINTDLGFSGTGARSMRFGVSVRAGSGINTFAGKLTDNVGGAFSPTFGGGIWNLTNTANSYTGNTTISAGTLGFANGALGASGTINASGGTLRWLSGNTQDISGRLAMTAATTSTFDTYGNDVTFANAIGSSTTGAIVKAGIGTLTLQGQNTYTGNTDVNGGTLRMQSGSSSITQTLGALRNQGGEATLNSDKSGAGNITTTFTSYARVAGASGNITSTGGTNGTNNIVNITGAAGFIDKGLYFGGSEFAARNSTNGYVRALAYGTDTNAVAVGTITSGRHVKLTSSPASQAAISLLSLNLQGGGVNWTTTSGALTVPGIIKSGGGAGSTISGGSLTGGTNTEIVIRTDTSTDSLTISSNLTQGTGALTKSGAGMLSLSGSANTYTGATYVNAGTLRVTAGNINSTASINVAAGASFIYNSSTALTKAPILNGTPGNPATFSGSGTVNASMTLNSIDDVLSPGNSPGIQAYGASQTWSSFTYEWELNDWNNVVAGTDIDQIQVTGSLDLSAILADQYVLNILSLTDLNASGLVGAGGLNTFTESDRTWDIITTTTGITGFDASEWQIVSGGFQDAETGTWSLGLDGGGNNLVLSYTAVPEPGAAILGSLGLLMILRRRR